MTLLLPVYLRIPRESVPKLGKRTIKKFQRTHNLGVAGWMQRLKVWSFELVYPYPLHLRLQLPDFRARCSEWADLEPVVDYNVVFLNVAKIQLTMTCCLIVAA